MIMSLFDTDFNNDKKCVYDYLLLQESPETLEEFLKFEDLVVSGFTNAFPDKIAFKWKDLQNLKQKRGL